MKMDRNEPIDRLTLPSAASLLKAKALQGSNRIIAATLSILEEVADEHDLAMAKLRAALPADEKVKVDLADWFSQERFDALRNRILRTVNDCRRDTENEIDALRLD